MTFENWLIFVAIWSATGFSLGPNALNCIAVASANGFRHALWAVAGILIAALTHMTAVILGVAALLLANAELFFILKMCGAAYLVWMGISLWRKSADLPEMPERRALSRFTLVRKSFFISMSNPKAILSYLAVFSQFLDPSSALMPQLVVLVPTALIITACVFTTYCAIGTGFKRFLSSVRQRLALNRSVGTFYIFAGLALATSDYHPGAQKPS